MEIQIVELIRRLWNNRPSRRLAKKKADIREICSQRRRIMSKNDVQAASELIIEQLENMPEFQDAQVIMLYYPIHNEVDVRPLLNKYMESKTILLPVVHRASIEMRPYTGKDNLHKGKFGIPEPKSGTFKGKPDLIIVPGVAFDKECNRLGRGKGFYDRFLKRFSSTTAIGVAYDRQIVDSIPTDSHDHKLDHVVTPTQIY